MSTTNAWSEGYVSEIGYTYGYYTEMNPLRSRLALLNHGIVPPPVLGNACELAFGQGISVAVHAAASPIQWHGTDFNPGQAAFAQELVENSGSDAKLYDQSFEEFCRRDDLPDFDFIGLHGIWSWISPENQACIVDFLKRKLKVGGLLYISYNTLPGWSAFAPMQHLMAQHEQTLGSGGFGVIQRIEQALGFVDRLLATNPIYARANPQIPERLKKLKEQNKQYLAHEYFNRHWYPMHFATLANSKQAAKLDFACSAHYLDSVDNINLTQDQLTLMREIQDPIFAQTVRDFMVNQQFRRDYWVKGVRKLSVLEQSEQLASVRVLLNVPREDVSLRATGSLGQADMNEKIYAPVLDLLGDHKPRTLGEIVEAMRPHNINQAQVLSVAMVLSGTGQLAHAQESAVIAKCKKQTDKLNRHLMRKSRTSGDINVLASPVTGGGFNTGRFQRLFAMAYSDGLREASEWAKFTWDILRAQGQRILRDGKAIESEEDNLAELNAQAETFKTKTLPILKALSIV
ncbi:MAG: methyltransferase regulatory domain-containing protein [Pseudomonadales bacterium]|jgi:SAM-dependent methyltransferase|nr:methyltransferase regulatory domain-containing protein [Pseudomonadales bacterium]